MDERIDKEKILIEARERFKIVHDSNFYLRESFKKNMRYTFNIENGQWDTVDIEQREKDHRPYLTSNKLGKFAAQVVNQEKGVADLDDVVPVDNEGDIEIAKIYNELINDIFYKNTIEDIYGSVCTHAVGGGYGYFRIYTEESDEDFNQDIKIKAIKNPLMVDVDPRGQFAFIREAIPIREFKLNYDEDDASDFEGNEDNELWYEDDKCYIAEYFRKVPKKKRIAEVLENDEIKIYELTVKNEKIIRENTQILREKTVDSYIIEWYKITGKSVLDYKIWPGKLIPIVEVVGDEIDFNGKKYKKALTTDAQNDQQAYNYWKTSLTEKIALSPKAPYLVTPQQINGFKEMWENANIKNTSILLYNQTALGPPRRQDPPQIDAGAITMLQLSQNDINDVLGRYEASTGATSNERSGRAIEARAQRSDLISYNFSNNFAKAKLKCKRILIDLIPKVYDNYRVIRLRNEQSNIEINKKFLDQNQNEIVLNDLSRGRYDIRVRSLTNPTKRQQISNFLRDLLQYSPPEYASALMPLLLQFIDAPGAQEALEAINQIKQQQLEAGQQKQSANNNFTL